MIYTTDEAAEMLKIARRTVVKWCGVLGFEKIGRDYIIDMEELKEIKRNCHFKRGRPKREETNDTIY